MIWRCRWQHKLWRCFSPSLGRPYIVLDEALAVELHLKVNPLGSGSAVPDYHLERDPHSGLGKFDFLFFFFSCSAGLSLLSTRWQGEVLMGFFLEVPPCSFWACVPCSRSSEGGDEGEVIRRHFIYRRVDRRDSDIIGLWDHFMRVAASPAFSRLPSVGHDRPVTAARLSANVETANLYI